MSQPANIPTDPERGDGGIQGVAGGHEQQQNQQPGPTQGKSNFGDSSGPLFSLYSKIAEDEDNKTTDRWQKDADGILIFTGLFSAAVAALLAVSVLDLRPNSQDISAFYLAEIYQILADPNVTMSPKSIPSTIARPPPFSPPRYAVWVNSLWFLSLGISLTCALLATSLHQWSRRYIRVTQPTRCNPEKRARLRAFFANGAEKMGLPWAVESLPTLIHLSLFLFFIGLVIFLFNVNQSVFISVIWWMGLFSVVYVGMTVMPIFRPDSPYYAPLSSTAWSIHALLSCALYEILWFIAASPFIVCLYFVYFWNSACPCSLRYPFDNMPRRNFLTRLRDQSVHYGRRMLAGEWKAAEETASTQSSEIDVGILDWTIGALSEDDTLEKFFEAIPGFFSSQMMKNLKRPLPPVVRSKFADSFGGFLTRSLSSNSISEEVKNRRLDICVNAAKAICEPSDIEDIFSHLLHQPFNQLPLSFRTAEILIRWPPVPREIADILLYVRERDDRWIALARDKFGMPEDVLWHNIAHGDDSVLLAILIHKTRQVIRTNINSSDWGILSSLSKFDIHNTVPGLQNEFCALWNEIVPKARSEGWSSNPVFVLREIRQLYIGLHQGTDAAPTAFDSSTDDWVILCQPSSYPLCNTDTHHPNSTIPHRPHHPSRQESQPVPGGSAAPQQTEVANITPGLPSSAHHAPPAQASPSLTTNPVHIAPQASTPDTAHSIHESLQTSTLDRVQLVSTEVPYLSPESLLSTADPTPNVGRDDEPTPDTPVAQVGEISHIPTVTLVSFPHPNPVPVTVTPSTVPHLPSVPVEQQDPNMRQDSTAPHAQSDITQVSSQPTQIHNSIPSTGVTLQTSEESTGIPPTTISDPQSTPIVTVPPPSGGILPLSVESALVQSDHHLSHLPGPLSSTLTTAQTEISPQPEIPSVLDVHVTTGIGALSSPEHHETRDPDGSTPMEASLHMQQSGPSTLHIAQVALPPGDDQHDEKEPESQPVHRLPD